MTKLKKLFLLVPLMLLTVVTNAWAAFEQEDVIATEKATSTEKYFRPTENGLRDILNKAQVGDKIVFTKKENVGTENTFVYGLGTDIQINENGVNRNSKDCQIDGRNTYDVNGTFAYAVDFVIKNEKWLDKLKNYGIWMYAPAGSFDVEVKLVRYAPTDDETFITSPKTTVTGLGLDAGNNGWDTGQTNVNLDIFGDIQQDDQIVVKVKDNNGAYVGVQLFLTLQNGTTTYVRHNYYFNDEAVFNVRSIVQEHLANDGAYSYDVTNGFKWGELRIQGSSNADNGKFSAEIYVRKYGSNRSQLALSPLYLGGRTRTPHSGSDAGAVGVAPGQLQELTRSGWGDWANPGVCFKIKGLNNKDIGTDWMSIDVGKYVFSNQSQWNDNGQYRFKVTQSGQNGEAYIWVQLTSPELIAEAKANGIKIRGNKYTGNNGTGDPVLEVVAAKIDPKESNPSSDSDFGSRDWVVPNVITNVNDVYEIAKYGTTADIQPKAQKNDNGNYTAATWKKIRVELVAGSDIAKLNVNNSDTNDKTINIDNDGSFKIHSTSGEAGFVKIRITSWSDTHEATRLITVKIKDDNFNSETSGLYEVADGRTGDVPNRLYAMKKPGSTTNATPVIISLHGASNDYDFGQPGFNWLADNGTAIVIYPRGEKQYIEYFQKHGRVADGMVRSWESSGLNSVIGVKDGKNIYADVNYDIEFLRNILKDLTSRGIAYNKNRVYLTGHSNGAMMAYQAASEMSDQIAAFAAVSGFPVNEFHINNAGARPVPFLHIHGMSDTTINPTAYDKERDTGGCSLDLFINNMKLRYGVDYDAVKNGTDATKSSYTTGNSTQIRDNNTNVPTTYDYYKFVPDAKAGNSIAFDAQKDEAGTAGVGFEFIKVYAMGHTWWTGSSSDGYFDISDRMWTFLQNKTLPTPKKVKDESDRDTPNVMYNDGNSTVKFRADLATDARNLFYIPTGETLLARFGGDKNTYVNVDNPHNHNVYNTLQFQTRDNNHDGVYQGLHRMRLRIKGSTPKSYFVVRLKDLATGDNVLYKRFKADTRKVKDSSDPDDIKYEDAWAEIKANFTVPLGWHEYELWIEKGNATDLTELGFVELASGSFKLSEVTTEEAYNPENLQGLQHMNLVHQPKYNVGGRGIAKSYFPISVLESAAVPKKNNGVIVVHDPDNNQFGDNLNGGTTKPLMNSNWTNYSTTGDIYLGNIIREHKWTERYNDKYADFFNYDQPVTNITDDMNTLAFFHGNNAYTLRKTASEAPSEGDARAYGLNFGQFGAAGMTDYAAHATEAERGFPTTGIFAFKVAGTLDITMIADNVGSTNQLVKIFYVNSDEGKTSPQYLTEYYIGNGHKGEDGSDATENTSVTACLRMHHMGSDGTCIVFFCFEGINPGGAENEFGSPASSVGTGITNDLWVKGFVVKRPDLSMSIGRTDGKYGTTPKFGTNKPYRWTFKDSGFHNRDVYNLRDYRTYLCGTAYDENGTLLSGHRQFDLVDHLLVYSENGTSYAHFVGADGSEHLQFDTPTTFRYGTYKELVNGTVQPGVQDINYNEGGSVFDPIVNDGLKINVTGSGWVKVRARVPKGQHPVKMTIMTSCNGGNEHIKLMRYFKLLPDGLYHDYCDYLKASVFSDRKEYYDRMEASGALTRSERLRQERDEAETKYQSIFLVFEDISSEGDIETTIPKSPEGESANAWDGDDNNFQVDLQSIEWLNDDVPDYVYQRGQYLFKSQTPNESVGGHDANRELRRRQTVYGKTDATKDTPILYWQAGGAHKDAAVLIKKTDNEILEKDLKAEDFTEIGADNYSVYKYVPKWTNTGTATEPVWVDNGSKYVKLTTDNALEDGRWAYDTNWQLVSGGTNPKYSDDGSYTDFGMIPDRSIAEVQRFGGRWDFAPMPTLGLQRYVASNGSDHPNTDYIYHQEGISGSVSPLWQGAHTEMQSPRIYNQSYNASKRPSGIASIDEFTWISGTEFNSTNLTTNNEYDLPISGPFYRFMPMKNVTITAYVVPGNAEGKIYVLDETGKVVMNNSVGSNDWYRLGCVSVEGDEGTNIDNNTGVITPAKGTVTIKRNNVDVPLQRAKTVKITISARAGKEYFLTSTGMAIAVATMYFDEIGDIAKLGTQNLYETETSENSNSEILGNASTSNTYTTHYANVKLHRSFEKDKWYSLVLPFSMNEETFAKYFGVNAKCIHYELVDNGVVKLLHHKYNMIVAGRPVFIRPSEPFGSGREIEDVTLQAPEVIVDDFVGTDENSYKFDCSYSSVQLKRRSILMSSGKKGAEAQYAGQLLYYIPNEGDALYTLSGLRSWLEPECPNKDFQTTQASAKYAFRSFDYLGNLLDEDELTGIEEILMDDNDMKKNVLMVDKSDKVFDLNGRVVATGKSLNNLPAGIYIINGKKFVK